MCSLEIPRKNLPAGTVGSKGVCVFVESVRCISNFAWPGTSNNACKRSQRILWDKPAVFGSRQPRSLPGRKWYLLCTPWLSPWGWVTAFPAAHPSIHLPDFQSKTVPRSSLTPHRSLSRDEYRFSRTQAVLFLYGKTALLDWRGLCASLRGH